MKIDNFVENNIIKKNGVLHLDGHDEFGYSDGDKTENYIYETIKECNDISSSSRELETHIKDWASLYHFSRKRSLAYQSLKIPNTASVLEVGCGCGAITRYLGETAGYVLALEGSHRRAQIARERTRDLSSTEVLCAPFDDVKFTTKFDIVVCNGVLEYATMFTPGDDPHSELLHKLASLVKPGGLLIVAIENKFGLRYISSGKEEHTNIMYDGIEGYSRRPAGARTFGTKELESMLKKEFNNVELLLPIPDYKLPSAIIRDKLLDRATCAELIANMTSIDVGSFVPPKMHERLVWKELESGGLLRDFSNSLFFVSSNQSIDAYDSEWMGDIYSLQRNPKWATRTRIHLKADQIITEKEYLNDTERGCDSDLMTHSLSKAKWVNGPSIHTEIVRALCTQTNEPLITRLAKPVKKWWEAVEPLKDSEKTLQGSALDINWQNVIVDHENKKPIFIDDEWSLKETVNISWLIFRTINKFFSTELYYAHRWSRQCKSLSPYKMAKAVGNIVGEKVSLLTIYKSVSEEARMQRATRGIRISPTVMFLLAMEPIAMRRTRKLAARNVSIIINKLKTIIFRR